MTIQRPGGRHRWVRWIPLAFATLGFVALLASLAPQPTESEPFVASVEASATTTTSTPPSTSTTSSTTSTTRPLPPPINQITFGVVGEIPESINLVSGPAGNRVFDELVAAVQTSALRRDPATLTPTPGVVADVPSVDNGGIRYNDDGSVRLTYQISSSAVWNDGVPVSGDDFVFTASILEADRRVDASVRSLYGLIDEESWVVDNDSVSLTLTQRTLSWTDLFAPLLPAHQLAESDVLEDWVDQPWVSAAPYYLADVDGNAYALRPNAFYDHDASVIDEIVLRVFPYDGALVGAMELGIVQIGSVEEPLTLERLASIDDMSVETGVGSEWEHVAFQFSSGRFVANVESLSAQPSFREFVSAVIDRRSLVDQFFDGNSEPVTSVTGMSWPPAAGTGWAVDTDETERLDIRGDLSRETGDERASVVLVTTEDLQRNLVATEIVQWLATYDIDVVIELEEPGLFFNDSVIPGRFDIAEWAWAATPGPQGAVDDLRTRFLDLPTDGGFNFYHWGAPGSDSDPDAFERFVDLVTEMEQEMDLDRLSGLLQEADTLLAAETVVIPLFAGQVHVGVADDVLGFVVPPAGQPILLGISDWSILDPSGE